MTEQNWHKMRSDIYLRDRGICWVCNTFTDLDNYDLGHLVDRANNGTDTYDNLAVMHKSCNLSKPPHETLEEAMRWRLTAMIPNIRPTPTEPIPRQYPRRQPRRYSRQREGYKEPTIYVINGNGKNLLQGQYDPDYRQGNLPILREQSNDKSLIDRIKPATLCWMQGRPRWRKNHRSPMWRLLPPPYNQENIFTMRQTPPGAIETDSIKVIDTMQVLGGILTQEVNIKVGFMTYHVIPNNTNRPIATILQNTQSNTGKKSIGMGKYQIPLSAWREAKNNGMTFSDFIKQVESQEYQTNKSRLSSQLTRLIS